MGKIENNSKIYVAGHNGLVGSSLWRHLEASGFTNLVGRRSSELDLTNLEETMKFFQDEKPQVVFMAAGKVGGILANSTYPVEFLAENVRMMTNVLEAAHVSKVESLIYLGSSCIYPKYAAQPIQESSLLTGELEPTNIAYALAKIAGVIHVQGFRGQYGHQWISGMPTNLYGPNDNFDMNSSHVLPAMIRKFHEAKENGSQEVTLWGSGSPRREFMHVDDLAAACVFAIQNYDSGEPINLGVGVDISIFDLALLVKRIVGFAGEIVWDTSKPDGTPQKLLDTSTLNNLGWAPKIQLEDGIKSTYQWYLDNVHHSD